MDIGEQFTKQQYKALRKKIRMIYAQAAKDVQKKMDDFNAKHAAKDAVMLQKRKDGKITQEEYESWQKGQVFIGKQWDAKAKDIASTFTHASEEAAKIVNGGRLSVFEENMNYEMYNMERSLGIRTNFDLYNRSSVTKLIKDNPKLLPEWKINEKKDYVWNYRKVKNAVTQGIIQGEGISDISKRLVSELQTSNDKKMDNFARTAVTGAQNAGRQEMAEEAEEDGIEVKKQWIATLDDRTRDTHQELDGQIVPVKEPFTVQGEDGKVMEIMFPGDPNAEPCLVYNCRCTMREVYNTTPQARQRRAYREVVDENGKVHRESYITNATSYKEWKAEKEKQGNETNKETKSNDSKGTSFSETAFGKPLYPYTADIPDWDEFMKQATNYEGERTDYIQDVYHNSDVYFRPKSKYLYDGEPYCDAAPIDNAVARMYEKIPLIDDDRLILCDMEDAHLYLPNGKNDRRFKPDEAIAQVFHNDEQIVIAFNRDYMNGSLEESLKERERIISSGGILPNVFPVESPETVVMHEWGHTVYDYYSHALVYDDYDAKALFEWHKSLTKDEIKEGISEYASETFGEFCAECFAEMQAPNPRPIAKKYWGYMEKLIEKRYTYDK